MRIDRDLLEHAFPEDFVGTAVEVGAGDGVHMSTTLEYEKKGWRVLCIEPHPGMYEMCAKSRKLAINAACSDRKDPDGKLTIRYVPGAANHSLVPTIEPLTFGFISAFCRSIDPEVTVVPTRVDTLDQYLRENGFDHVDLVTIDVDGIEMKVLAGFDIDFWNPTAVMVENMFTNFDMYTWFEDHGYWRSGCDGANDLYTKENPRLRKVTRTKGFLEDASAALRVSYAEGKQDEYIASLFPEDKDA